MAAIKVWIISENSASSRQFGRWCSSSRWASWDIGSNGIDGFADAEADQRYLQLVAQIPQHVEEPALFPVRACQTLAALSA